MKPLKQQEFPDCLGTAYIKMMVFFGKKVDFYLITW